MKRALIIFSEAVVVATVWFIALSEFSELVSTELPFIVSTIYVLGLILGNIALYIFVRISISTRMGMQSILVKIDREDIVARPHHHQGIRWVMGAIFFIACLIMAIQGMAALGTHLLLITIGKPALSEVIRNFAIGMALFGNIVVFVPTIIVWLSVKLLHKRIGRHESRGHESESPSEEFDLEAAVSKPKAFKIPIPQVEVPYFPIPITGLINLVKSPGALVH